MAVCDGCFNFKAFGKKCWFYWEEKKTCSQHRTAPDQEPGYRSDTVEFRG
ncbi:hypothetical protein HY642_03750 [Candidatus Woesearchaeota archaeon]|nr:hypothetical protein [Candidatus Woesearchaeota archaeon]